ncbi:alpha/beta hydrolase [Asticcacaulis sp. BYS171W]|uniref:Alpha/beta hydrolase n=1 Tax=Asticcacaulis aquaticus TaxID=2984212 RepID=A0ABT5HTJ7_9CAUL|nr:alpha/beta hydrolase [Asticcacaulis aquaticus]MDC7683388.1 alpha/beta hydrolase [Asticcacaulis aquaticus]
MSERSPQARCRPRLAPWFILFIAIFVACTSGAKSATPFPSAETARFSVEVVGQGPDIILIPGLNCSREVWDATVTQLKGRYRLHVINIAGFGSEPAAANRTGPVIDPVTEALNAYIVQNKLQKPIVVGHSLGGLTGLRLASQHPDSVSKVIVVDALPFIGVLFNPMATTETIIPQATQMRDNMLKGDDATYKAQQQAALAALPAPKTEAEKNRLRIATWGAQSDRHVVAQAFYDDMTMDLRQDLPKITAAVVLFFPHHASMPYTADQTEAFYKTQYAGTAHFTARRFDNSQHFIMYDQPDAFAAALIEALK